MSSEMVYTCDKCKKVIKGREYSLTFEEWAFHQARKVVNERDLCRPCLEALKKWIEEPSDE